MKRKIIPYNPSLKQLARDLRSKSSMSEIILWNRLKGKQLMGFDFYRQKPIDNFIVDFFCNELIKEHTPNPSQERLNTVFARSRATKQSQNYSKIEVIASLSLAKTISF